MDCGLGSVHLMALRKQEMQGWNMPGKRVSRNGSSPSPSPISRSINAQPALLATVRRVIYFRCGISHIGVQNRKSGSGNFASAEAGEKHGKDRIPR